MQNLTGHSIGRYHIREEIGHGGMAVVYLAYDTILERNVAFKIIRSDYFGSAVFDKIRKRFEREAKALAKLSHPNIIKVFDFGEFEGSPYLVMEYIAGGSLKELLGKPLPWETALRILIPIAEGLEYAHEHEIIHRDVKPANILISQSGDPLITDFGIAKILEMSEDVALTGTGVGIGTPEYMAPEQGLGKSSIDQRVDIYSLGIILYEMVTGKKPYTAETPMAVVFKHISDPLPSPREIVPGITETVEAIIFKATAKKPENRYQTISEFRQAVKRLFLEKQIEPNLLHISSDKPKPKGKNQQQKSTSYDLTQDKLLLAYNLKHEEEKKQQKLPQKAIWGGTSIIFLVLAIFIVIFYPSILQGISLPPDLSMSSTKQALEMITGQKTTKPRESFSNSISNTAESTTAESTPTAIPISTITSVTETFTNTQSTKNKISTGNLENVKIVSTLQVPGGQVTQIKFSPQDDVYSIGTSAGLLEIYDSTNNEILYSMDFESGINHLFFSPKNNLLACLMDNEIDIIDYRRGTVVNKASTEDHFLAGYFKDENELTLFEKSGNIITYSIENDSFITIEDLYSESGK